MKHRSEQGSADRRWKLGALALGAALAVSCGGRPAPEPKPAR